MSDLLGSFAAMADPERRGAAARTLAREFGAEDLIIFVRDEAIGRSLPAPGFPQTLRGSSAWRNLVDRAIAAGTASTEAASAIGLSDGTVAVLLGTPEPARVTVGVGGRESGVGEEGASRVTEGVGGRESGVGEEGASSPTPDTRHPTPLTELRTLLPLLGALFRAESISRRAEADSILARQAAAQSTELAAKLDVTRAELQRAVVVAENATRARDEFLASVSHELRTPLTSIIGWIQLLREETDPAQVAEGLETIDRNARAQSRLIEDILDFSRINAGKLRLEVRPIELADVIAAAVEVVRPAADAKGVALDAVLDPTSGLVSGDADRLQQVVWNLLANAVKFTPRGGRVQVRLDRVTSHSELTVSDTGEGISKEFLPFVFDRFSQADSTSSRKHGGLGLGLGIVRHLVELHGGTVQAFSAGLGNGATFVVRLPLIVAHHQTGVPDVVEHGAAARAELGDLSGVSVLIAEDNDDARKLLTTIFQRCGATVEAAESVPAALRLLSAYRPDIIISDIEMPGEDGYSLIRKIRAQESRDGRIPAIALTAYTRTPDRVRALAAGFQMHMGKPVEPTELVAAVKSLLSTSRAREPEAPKSVE
jgi:signal transduction histidine kinase/ActR/RegA family two-component response regulator